MPSSSLKVGKPPMLTPWTAVIAASRARHSHWSVREAQKRKGGKGVKATVRCPDPDAAGCRGGPW